MPKLSRHRKVQIIVTTCMVVASIYPNAIVINLIGGIIWLWGDKPDQ